MKVRNARINTKPYGGGNGTEIKKRNRDSKGKFKGSYQNAFAKELYQVNHSYNF